MLHASYAEPVFVLKHSNSCPVSAFGNREFAKLGEEEAELALYKVTVQSNREASTYLTDAVSVEHETPQAMLIKDGEAVETWSHWSVRAKKLREALGEHA